MLHTKKAMNEDLKNEVYGCSCTHVRSAGACTKEQLNVSLQSYKCFACLAVLTFFCLGGLLMYDFTFTNKPLSFKISFTRNNSVINESSKMFVSRNSSCSPTVPEGVTFPSDPAYLSQCSYKSIKRNNKLILAYSRPPWMFSGDLDNAFSRCKSDSCTLTDDRSLVQQADAVVVHVCRLGPPRPPSFNRSNHQIWVAYGKESPIHYAGDHNSPAWKSVFNWTMTYRVDSDIFCPYGLLTPRLAPSSKNYTHIAMNKKKAVAWFMSNCHTQSQRDKYVKQLQKYITVDIYGHCGSLSCPRSKEFKCLQLLNSTYYFYLSFENSFCRDYVTEKMFKVFNNTDVIPVVRGGANYSQYFPANTFINTADFGSPLELAAHLKTLMSNRGAYAELLKTKDNFLLDTEVPETYYTAFCELCSRLHSSDIQTRVYPDFMRWISEGMCRKPNDV